MEYKNIENYRIYLENTGKTTNKTQLNIAQKFINYLDGNHPTNELVNQFCNNRNKKSIIKYFLIANNVTLEEEKEIKDYTNSNIKDIAEFLKFKEFTACKQLTIKDYRNKLEKYYAKYDELTESNVIEFLSKEKVTVKAVYITLFKQYFSFYNKPFKLYIKKDDVINAKNEVTKVKLLNNQEIKSLEKYIDTLNDQDHNQYLLKTILYLYMYTGCRVSELVNKKFSEIDFRKKSIEVIGKGNKQRTVFLDVCPKLIKFLRDHKKRYAKQLKTMDLPIILNQNYQNIGINTIQKKVKKVFKELGFNDDKSIHSLRHSFGTVLANNNVPIELISKLLGHSNTATTKIYVDLSQQLRKVAKGKYKT